jgi:hypothetical protein
MAIRWEFLSASVVLDPIIGIAGNRRSFGFNQFKLGCIAARTCHDRYNC